MKFRKQQGCLVAVVGAFSFVIFFIGFALIDQNIDEQAVLLSGWLVLFVATVFFNIAFKMIGVELAIQDRHENYKGFDSPDYLHIKQDLKSERHLNVFIFIVWLMISLLQSVMITLVIYYNALYFGYFIINILLYALILTLVPEIFNKNFLGYIYQRQKYFIPSHKKDQQGINISYNSPRNTYYFPLKLITTKAPSYMYNLNDEVMYETPTVTGNIDIISTTNASEEMLTIISYIKTTKWAVVKPNQESLLDAQKKGMFDVEFKSKEGTFTYRRKRFLSRRVQIYKDNTLYLETKLKRRGLHRVVLINTYHDEPNGLSIAMVYLILYGTLI